MSNKQKFREKFEELEDAILLEKWQQEELTESAREALEAELVARGFELVEPMDEAELENMQHDDSLVVVTAFDMPTEAHIFKNMLIANDIPAFLKDEHMVRVDSIITRALGGVKIMIRPEHYDQAKELLRQFESNTYANDSDEDRLTTDSMNPGPSDNNASRTQSNPMNRWVYMLILGALIGLGFIQMLGAR